MRCVGSLVHDHFIQSRWLASIKWSYGDVRENENAIEEPRGRKHRPADHCNLNVHDDRGFYRFEIYFPSCPAETRLNP
jgi:hypothetical protein